MAVPNKKVPGVNGFKYKPLYGLVVVCKDEEHQQEVYDSLKSQGYKVKVVAV